jgi:oligopeptidase A
MRALLLVLLVCGAGWANPLIELKFPIPWEEIRPEMIAPAMDHHLKVAGQRRATLAAAKGPRTWANTIAAREEISGDLDRAWGWVMHLLAVNNSPALRREFNAVQPRVVRFQSGLPLDPALHEQLQEYAASAEAKGLKGDRKRLLEVMLERDRRSGVSLSADKRARVLELRQQLSQLSAKFSQNALDSLNSFEMLVEEEKDLAGLPEEARKAARASAEAKGKAGYRFTLQAPSLLPVMEYASDRDLREQMQRANWSVGAGEPFNNRPLVEKIVELRRELAALLGYGNFADYQLEPRMAGSGSRVQAFLRDLEDKTRAAYEREKNELGDFRKSLEGADAPAMEFWDERYYQTKLRQKRFAFDQNELRPYFELNRVLAGLFGLVKDLYGIEVSERKDLPVWQEQVRAFVIRNGRGEELATFYADFFPRESKRSGAWQNSLQVGAAGPGGRTPHVGVIVTNITPPNAQGVSLLTHREVETVFHEFGHLLHLALSEGPLRELNGTNVAWDFVELPSQIMENFTWERMVLDRFAVHYKTGERLPQNLFERMTKARNFGSATAQMRQLMLGTMDIQLHKDFRVGGDYGDPVDYARGIAQRFVVGSYPPGTCTVCNFIHVFAGGYAAGYYSYKWAEVLDADAFGKFKAAGVVSALVGEEFRRTILSRGNTQPAAELFRAFLGRDPDPAALLRRSGLL